MESTTAPRKVWIGLAGDVFFALAMLSLVPHVPSEPVTDSSVFLPGAVRAVLLFGVSQVLAVLGDRSTWIGAALRTLVFASVAWLLIERVLITG